MTEPEAFRTMQKTSMDTGIPIREIAQVILETDGRQLCRFG
jgi:AmiR/NasT family two-component response regulator